MIVLLAVSKLGPVLGRRRRAKQRCAVLHYGAQQLLTGARVGNKEPVLAELIVEGELFAPEGEVDPRFRDAICEEVCNSCAGKARDVVPETIP